MSGFRMTSLSLEMDPQSLETRSGKVYRPLHLGILETIEGIVDRLQVALGPSDQLGPRDLELVRRLMRRLTGMLHLSRESEYWTIVLPELLAKILDTLFEIDEFWAPSVVRDLISVISAIRNP
jgi:hypothetical protein